MRRFFAFAFAAFVVSASAAAFAGELNLTILHTNDVHGRLAQTPPFGSQCSPQHIAENKCRGGAARLASAALRGATVPFV